MLQCACKCVRRAHVISSGRLISHLQCIWIYTKCIHMYEIVSLWWTEAYIPTTNIFNVNDIYNISLHAEYRTQFRLNWILNFRIKKSKCFYIYNPNIAIIQHFQNKVLRNIIVASWYIRYGDLHRDLDVVFVTSEIQPFTEKHKTWLHRHVNVDVIQYQIALTRCAGWTKEIPSS